jgi:hypothetical protein
MLAVELLLDLLLLLLLLPLASDAEPLVLLAEPDLFIGVADVGRFSSFFFNSCSYIVIAQHHIYQNSNERFSAVVVVIASKVL